MWNLSHFIRALLSFKCKCIFLSLSFFPPFFFYYERPSNCLHCKIRYSEFHQLQGPSLSSGSRNVPNKKTSSGADLHFFSLLITAPGWDRAPAERCCFCRLCRHFCRRNERRNVTFFSSLREMEMWTRWGSTSSCQNTSSFQIMLWTPPVCICICPWSFSPTAPLVNHPGQKRLNQEA